MSTLTSIESSASNCERHRNLDTLSNFFPSGSLSITSKMSSKIVVPETAGGISRARCARRERRDAVRAGTLNHGARDDGEAAPRAFLSLEMNDEVSRRRSPQKIRLTWALQ